MGKMSELNTWLASSMYPIVDHQYSEILAFDSRTNKSLNVFNWFEKRFGFLNFNSCNNTYTYKITDSRYQIMTVSNLLMAMVTDKFSFDQIYNKAFFFKHLNEPQLSNIDYPSIHVEYAYFNHTRNEVLFGLKTDCTSDVRNTSFLIQNANGFQSAFLYVSNKVFD
jgi:hypothetical protein